MINIQNVYSDFLSAMLIINFKRIWKIEMDVLLIVSQYIKIITISPYYIAVSYFWNMLERKLTYTCSIGLEEGDTIYVAYSTD